MYCKDCGKEVDFGMICPCRTPDGTANEQAVGHVPKKKPGLLTLRDLLAVIGIFLGASVLMAAVASLSNFLARVVAPPTFVVFWIDKAADLMVHSLTFGRFAFAGWFLYRQLRNRILAGESKYQLYPLLLVVPFYQRLVAGADSAFSALCLMVLSRSSPLSIEEVGVINIIAGTLISLILGFVFLYYSVVLYEKLVDSRDAAAAAPGALRVFLISYAIVSVVLVCVAFWQRRYFSTIISLEDMTAHHYLVSFLSGFLLFLVEVAPIAALYFSEKKKASQSGRAVGPFVLAIPLFALTVSTFVLNLFWTLIGMILARDDFSAFFASWQGILINGLIRYLLTAFFAVVCIRFYKRLTADSPLDFSEVQL